MAADHLGHLREALGADHALEVAHEHRVRVRARDAADDVVGGAHVRDPVAQRLVERVLQRLRAALDRNDRRAEQVHAVDVRRLPADVFAAHVDDALEAEQGGGGGAGDAVLAGAGLGDDARLAHPPGEQRLADAVVDLVGAGVVEVLALEVDAGAAGLARQALGEVQAAGPADVAVEVVVELALELGVVARRLVALGELVQGGHQRFGDVAAAVGAEPPAGVGDVGQRGRHELLARAPVGRTTPST